MKHGLPAVAMASFVPVSKKRHKPRPVLNPTREPCDHCLKLVSRSDENQLRRHLGVDGQPCPNRTPADQRKAPAVLLEQIRAGNLPPVVFRG